MKRLLASVLTLIILLSSFAAVQAAQNTTTTTQTTVATQPDPLAVLIAAHKPGDIRTKLETMALNKTKIRDLRALYTVRVNALGVLIANMPNDEDNEALEKAREIVEDLEDRIESDAANDRKFLRDVRRLQNLRLPETSATRGDSRKEGRKQHGVGRGSQDDDEDARKNGRVNKNLRQNRRAERNESALLKSIDNILRSQQRMIDRLNRRIDRVDNLLVELR